MYRITFKILRVLLESAWKYVGKFLNTLIIHAERVGIYVGNCSKHLEFTLIELCNM